MITPKTYLFLITILFAFTTHSQKQLTIEYDFSLGGTTERVTVRANNLACYSKTSPNINPHNGMECDINCPHVFKDYQKGTLVYEDESREKIWVRENLNLFVWKPTEEKQKILEYQCYKATCSFRGRDYEAWFTTDLPFKSAPWKFHGLPGVVLKISSKDEYLDVEARGLKISENKEELSNPFIDETCISWEEFRKIYIVNTKKAHDFFRTVFAKHGKHSEGMTSYRPEIILESNRRMLTMEELKSELEKYKEILK
jgi:hypothetical protein